MSRTDSDEQVLVTVVVPVRDSAEDIPWVLDSLHDQGLGDGQRKVIVVDDGSVDGTAELLDQRARRDPTLRVIHCSQPGGLAAARNLAIEQAAGRYLFFLDVETALTEGSLGALVDVADREGSDVVLGKVRGTGGRTAPRSMFTETRTDADLVADNVFYTLSPYRLIRRGLVDRLGVRFPTDLAVGEDQPFMARCYLGARKVSICADRDYVLLRPCPQPATGSSADTGVRDQLELAAQVIGAVEESTAPGPLRDGVLRRTLRTTVAKIVSPVLLDEYEEAQRAMVDRLADVLSPIWTAAVSEHLEPLDRTKIALVLSRELESLRGILQWEEHGGQRPITYDDAGFRSALPSDLASAIGRDRLFEPSVTARAELDSLRVSGESLSIRTRAFVESCALPADATLLRLARRDTKQSIDLPAARVRVADLKDGCGLDSEFTVEAAELDDGVWDAFVVQRFGDQELRRRLGAERSGDVGIAPRFLRRSDGVATGQAYFTKKYGNLSIDRGFVLTTAQPRARIIGLLGPEDGLSTGTALVRFAAPSAVRVLAHFGTTAGTDTQEDQELASVAVGSDLLAVPLAVDSIPPGEVLRLVVATDTAEAVAVPEEGEPVSTQRLEQCHLDLAEDGWLRRKETAR